MNASKADFTFCAEPMGIEIEPGETVWVVERNEDLDPAEVSGFLFLAQTEGYVIAAPFPYGFNTAGDQLEYFAMQTREMLDAGLKVFPVCDCYVRREDAVKEMEAGK